MKGNKKLVNILAVSTLCGASTLSGLAFADGVYNPNHRNDRAYRGAVVESNDAFRTTNRTSSGYIGIDGLVVQNCDALPGAKDVRNMGMFLTGLAYVAGGRALYEAYDVQKNAKKSGKNGKDGADGRDGQNGTNGTNGRDGINGQNGRDGIDGRDGAMGPQGPRGPMGPQGPPGEGYTPTIGDGGISTVGNPTVSGGFNHN